MSVGEAAVPVADVRGEAEGYGSDTIVAVRDLNVKIGALDVA